MKQFKDINPIEESRTYMFPEGQGDVTFYRVNKLAVSDSGTHYLETTNGEKFIVAPGWMSISIDTPTWSF